MIYRDATPGDAPALTALFATSFTATFGHLYAPQDLAAFLGAADETAWGRELSDPAFSIHVAEEDGVLAGYIKLGPAKLPFTPRGPSAELRQLYVLEAWQGAGIARILIDWAIAQVRSGGAKDLYLSVYIDNHRAKRFYERLGFERIGTYDFPVGNHIDQDDLMRLAL